MYRCGFPQQKGETWNTGRGNALVQRNALRELHRCRNWPPQAAHRRTLVCLARGDASLVTAMMAMVALVMAMMIVFVFLVFLLLALAKHKVVLPDEAQCVEQRCL